MLRLHFITSGNLTVTLSGYYLGLVVRAPQLNLKTFITRPDIIYLEAKDMANFTDLGIIELLPVANAKEKLVNAMIDSQVWGWFASAEILLERNGKTIIHENFQSGTKGPLGNPKRYRSYEV